MSLDESVRRQLVVLARRKRCRDVALRPDRPTEWRPQTVRNPFAELDDYFTEAAAWEFIASKLESGHEVETIVLHSPRDAKGYVLHVELESGHRPLYVKLQLGPARSLGGAFTIHHPGKGERNMDTRRGIKLASVENKSPELACSLCGSSAIKTAFHPHRFHYGSGEKAAEISVEVPSRACRDCGFMFLDAEAEDLKHDAVCRHLGVLTPEEVKRIRMCYGMTRADFAEVSGLGVATLARWENGLLIQTIANDRYVRLISHAENMQRLRSMRSTETAPPSEQSENIAPFPHLQLTDHIRREEEGFQLRRAS